MGSLISKTLLFGAEVFLRPVQKRNYGSRRDGNEVRRARSVSEIVKQKVYK
tara:strand:- start:110 stop:262 length:153 start_codon:yes stop_codon:yes gene_type:complete